MNKSKRNTEIENLTKIPAEDLVKYNSRTRNDKDFIDNKIKVHCQSNNIEFDYIE